MNPNQRVAEILVDELARGGLQHVCIAPGSRSTPLTLAFAAHPRIKVHSHIDERSAAFFALGLALATEKPVAMVCTSGSAAANFLPAIVEARMSQVPLLVLTADRPHELRHSGANQTIDQVKMFGDQVLWSVDLAVPETAPLELAQRNVRTLAARALATADGWVKGAVHLNLPFRKPLEATAEEAAQHSFSSNPLPHTRILRGQMLPTAEQVQALAQIVESHERGVIVCGPRCESGEFPQAVLALARATGYPIFADALSGLRFCDSNVIGTYDLFLSGRPALADAEVILRFGAVPTSAVLCAALAGSAAKHRIHVSASGVWADDDHSVSYLLQAEAGAVCNQLAAQCETRPKTRLTRTRWADGLRMLEQNTRLRLAGVLSDAQFFDQVAVHHLFSGLDAVSVFVGNSLAVRHVDELISAYAQLHPRDVRLYGSRGASGIDGNVSTALGIAAADPARPTIALLGDVTTYHDMNGLLAVQRLGLRNVTFVVLHNNGGGIFRRLPVAGLNQEPTFMDLFLTPHALNFELVAQLYGLQYARADSRAALQLLQWPTPRLRGTADMPPALIEIPTDSAHDLTCRNAVRKAVLEKLKSGEF